MNKVKQQYTEAMQWTLDNFARLSTFAGGEKIGGNPSNGIIYIRSGKEKAAEFISSGDWLLKRVNDETGEEEFKVVSPGRLRKMKKEGLVKLQSD